MPVIIGRRELVVALAGAAAGPIVASAQQPDRMRRIGVKRSRPQEIGDTLCHQHRVGAISWPRFRRPEPWA
jgi:hypothetical protein